MTSAAEQTLLDYYMEHGISPVRYDISDLRKHLERRESLYRGMGILPSFFEGKKVLEVGPGGGHNSLYIASCMPGALDLVEPNPTGIQHIAEVYGDFPLPHTKPDIIEETLQAFSSNDTYDFVICENWLDSTHEHLGLLKKLGTFLKPGGVLLVSSTSKTALLLFSIRRILTAAISDDRQSFEEKTKTLVTAFSPHLGTLADMSRPHEDWVQDNMMGKAVLRYSLSPELIFEELGPEFTIYQSTPRLFTDWRWFKSLYGEARQFNGAFLDSYRSSSHNLIHYKETHPPRPIEENLELERLCAELLDEVIAFNREKASMDVAKVIPWLEAIMKNLAPLASVVPKAIEETIELISRDDVSAAKVAAMTHLAEVFGREIVYLSLTKDAAS